MIGCKVIGEGCWKTEKGRSKDKKIIFIGDIRVFWLGNIFCISVDLFQGREYVTVRNRHKEYNERMAWMYEYCLHLCFSHDMFE